MMKHQELPLGEVNLPVAFVRYRVDVDPGLPGTRIAFTDELNPVGSPAVTVNLTTNGKSKRPRVVNDAMIYGGGAIPRFLRGDANGDGHPGIADIVAIVENLFAGRLVFFDCPKMLDADDDGALDVADPISLAAYLFRAGSPPPPPFAVCGADPTPDLLACPQPNCR
jgi:hypothetical protein